MGCRVRLVSKSVKAGHVCALKVQKECVNRRLNESAMEIEVGEAVHQCEKERHEKSK